MYHQSHRCHCSSNSCYERTSIMHSVYLVRVKHHVKSS